MVDTLPLEMVKEVWLQYTPEEELSCPQCGGGMARTEHDDGSMGTYYLLQCSGKGNNTSCSYFTPAKLPDPRIQRICESYYSIIGVQCNS